MLWPLAVLPTYMYCSSPHPFPYKALIRLSNPQFKLILDSVVWALKHTMRDVAEIGEEGTSLHHPYCTMSHFFPNTCT